ncbi:MAG: hypothetical protein AB7G08_29525 [Hyphomicrobiaceae bacterium]
MKVRFKITADLLESIRADLIRPHAFAHERVGFISTGIAAIGNDVVALARAYRPVPDEDYLNDHSVGAMMGREAIRKALEWSMQAAHASFHVHTHGGWGIPGFSSVDLRENRKFVPDFFKVSARFPHGAIVLSDTAATGQVWLGRSKEPVPIDSFMVVGPGLKTWGRK